MTIAALVTAAGVLAMPAVMKSGTAQKEEVAEDNLQDAGVTVTAQDMAVLEELGGLGHRIDSLDAFDVTGSIQTTDPADPSGPQKVDFRYCRQGTRLYYKLGKQETIVSEDGMLLVDHHAEKMFLMPSKDAETPGILPSGKQIAGFFAEEGYKIARRKRAGLQWIELERPNHATMKVYRVGYDNARFVREVYMRLTDLSDPFNTEKDQVIHATVDKWSISDPAAELFDARRYISRKGTRFVPVEPYKHFAFIQP
ncbi:hypothetical protein [Chitinophaga caseinilytica]|uniref:Outer membrane lipoprotein-sorting protein n=1 Tax=Chitinophaga caseinilytica TaxID=2267521 RepID=A0ABZ2YXR9_9BACT